MGPELPHPALPHPNVSPHANLQACTRGCSSVQNSIRYAVQLWRDAAQPCMTDSKKPPRPRLAWPGIGTTLRLHVTPHISQSVLRSQGTLVGLLQCERLGLSAAHLRQQISPTGNRPMPMSTPHHVHDGHGVPAVPPSFMQTGSQQQLPDSLCRDASWYLRVRAEAARRRAARWVACAAGALVLTQLHLLVLFAHVADKHRPTQGFALVRGVERLPT